MPTPEQTPTTLLLCRHGESTWNAARRIQGQSPLAGGLSELGRRQAQRLAERLRSAGVDVLYSSDLRRALETAQEVGAVLGLRIRLDPRWREVDLGLWQGLTGTQVQERWPEEWAAIQRGEDLPRGGGETYAQVQARATEALADLVRHHQGQTVVVVTHGGPIRLCVAAIDDEPIEKLYRRGVPITNTSVTTIQAQGTRFQLVTLADAAHLNAVAEAEPRSQPMERSS